MAVVTGVTGGIGGAVMNRLAAEDWRIVTVDIQREGLAKLSAEWPERVLDRVADVRDQDAVTGAVALAEAEFGGLDAAVGCAAVMAGGTPLWQTTDTGWDALFDNGVRGIFHLARAAVPALLRRPEPRSGRFVALASAAAHRGLWYLAGYNAAKHAVVGLIRGLATDLRSTGVTEAAVSPGSPRAAMLDATADLYGLADVEEFAQRQLVERLLEPEEVAAVCWLCGEQASAITGTVVPADGGFIS
ncbi:MAG TPA: mycofactocin-coupled SDR family oxidoreductase [Amycolatopsis sp.]|uniref:mycofactocin-coupled SDR family oxidoreductase n=1 Tax=Amycolatopsis sp. TaxID=37632 RepID=UPI002B465F0D|nr:mycofactocin-coupled SDR family oxidoreductase [Amycolatopsis sp.]HKS48629.1 mycofactocin-coupled SDR family oxidoreductase [Amycolatopsis sp.]